MHAARAPRAMSGKAGVAVSICIVDAARLRAFGHTSGTGHGKQRPDRLRSGRLPGREQLGRPRRRQQPAPRLLRPRGRSPAYPESPFVFMSTNKVYGDAPNEKPARRAPPAPGLRRSGRTTARCRALAAGRTDRASVDGRRPSQQLRHLARGCCVGGSRLSCVPADGAAGALVARHRELRRARGRYFLCDQRILDRQKLGPRAWQRQRECGRGQSWDYENEATLWAIRGQRPWFPTDDW